MRAKRAKYIRRIFRKDYPTEETTSRYITEPVVLPLVTNENMVRFKFQYINEGFKRVVKLAKNLYKTRGLLPR